MNDGDIEHAVSAINSRDEAVDVLYSSGIVVLDGPQAVIDRLVAGDPALRAGRRVQSQSNTAIGALGALSTLTSGTGAGRTGGAQTVFQLDAVGQALFESGSLSTTGDGFFRLFGKTADGTISAHGALKPITMAPQQLATAQIAMATVALTAAIKEVQEAVERVEDKVDLLRDILDAERDGAIIGANRALRRRAEHLGFDSQMSATDWHAIDDIGVSVEQQIERLRSFVRKRLLAAEGEGLKISGRLDAVEHARDVAETLALLVVALDSLFLYQQMRVLRIKATQPEFAPAAADEARALLDEHATEDAELVGRLRAIVAERITVEALEVLRFRTALEINRLAPEVNETLSWFADQRGVPYEPFEAPPLPGAADVVDEVKERSAALASGGKRAVDGLTDRVRNRTAERSGTAADEALEAGDTTPSLPSSTDDGLNDPTELTRRFSKARSAAMARIRRGKSDAESGQHGGEENLDDLQPKEEG